MLHLWLWRLRVLWNEGVGGLEARARGGQVCICKWVLVVCVCVKKEQWGREEMEDFVLCGDERGGDVCALVVCCECCFLV